VNIPARETAVDDEFTQTREKYLYSSVVAIKKTILPIVCPVLLCTGAVHDV